MRALIQRVSHSSVTICGELRSSIGKGLLILVGIGDDDSQEDIDYIVKKTVNLRVFDDSDGVMNLSLLDIKGELMLISQFTLMASTKKGNRTSYIRAARPDISTPLYQSPIRAFEAATEQEIATGEFGADMKVDLLNDGPVTIMIDSKLKDF